MIAQLYEDSKNQRWKENRVIVIMIFVLKIKLIIQSTVPNPLAKKDKVKSKRYNPVIIRRIVIDSELNL